MEGKTGFVAVPSMVILHNTRHLSQLINHKLTILEESIKLMEESLDEMCFHSMLAVEASGTTNHKWDIPTPYVRHCPYKHGGVRHQSAIEFSVFGCDTDSCSICADLARLFDLEKNETLSIHSVNQHILLYGGVVVSGRDNELVCSIISSSSVWTKLKNIVEELSSLLCFILLSHTCAKKCILLDARVSNHRLLKAFMESLHCTQRKTGNSIDIARVLIDRPTQTGTIMKSIKTSRSLPVDIVTSTECFQKHTSTDSLPVQLGGAYQFDQRGYIQFQQEVDDSVDACTQSINAMLRTSHTLSRIPASMQQCSQSIAEHKASISSLSSLQKPLVTSQSPHDNASTKCNWNAREKEDSSKICETLCELPAAADMLPCHQVSISSHPVPAQRPVLADLLLQNTDTGQTLKQLRAYTKGAEIYKPIIDSLATLTVLTTNITRLKRLADQRLNTLYGHKKLWLNIEEITRTLTLLKRAHEHINVYRTASSNLLSAKQQLKKFSGIESSIKTLLKHGEKLLHRTQEILKSNDRPVDWLQQLTIKLQTEICFVSSLFNKTKSSVTRTYNCYVKLHQVYDWALDAMKFISQDSMDVPMTHEALELLASGLKSFMEQKTLIDDVAFDEISREARFLSNRKLSEQCKMAKRRCSETKHLAKTRLDSITKKQQEMEKDRVAVEAQSAVIHCEASEACRFEWRCNSTQSAPATPALTAKCNNRAELKRRSQSLEDDIAVEILQETGLSTTTSSLSSIPSNLATSQSVETKEIGLPGDVELSGVDNPDKLEVSETDDKKNADEESNNRQNFIRAEDLENSTVDVECHTVYRGDKFIESADVTMSLEDLHCNNNTLFIESPALENGHVVFAPTEKNVLSETDDSTVDQGALTFAPTPSLVEDIPAATFDLIALDNSCDEEERVDGELPNETSPQEDTLSPPPTQCQIQSRLSLVLSVKQKQKAMQKRRSFHGFTSALTAPLLSFAKGWRATEDNAKRHSVSEVPEHMEQDSSLTISIEPLAAAPDAMEISLKDKDTSRLLKVKRMDKSMSLITSSTDSLPSLPEDDVIDSNTVPRLNRQRHSDKGWSPVPVNSHLNHRRVLPSQRSSSMADLRLTESQIKSRITLAHIIDELVQTERDYVISLRLVVDTYIPQLAREDVPHTLRGKRAVIFGNVEKIYEFHNRYFVEDLIRCENEPFKIGQCFLKHEAQFLMYALYNKNKPKSDALMIEYGASFFKEQQLLMGDKMDLSSYLLKPVQRMGKYALILKQVVKECRETSPEYEELALAEQMVKFCLQHGNDLLAMDALQDCDVNLQEQGTLLLQDEFTVYKNRKKASRHLFLFEHLLVMSKTKRIGAGRDQYVYKTSVKTADVGLTENVGEDGIKFEIWFRKRTGESWTCQAKTSQVKNRWVNAIEKLLWTQALKSRECKLSELSTMGVGRKPSLDLKKSADNIQDRFIPTLNKPLGKRHSMDSLNLCETFDEPKKRPYSTISLATSSSSSSSTGSTGPPSRNRRSYPWLDLKAAVLGKDHARHLSLRKMYKSENRIHSCDSGISSCSDAGLATKFFSSTEMLNSNAANRNASETEV